MRGVCLAEEGDLLGGDGGDIFGGYDEVFFGGRGGVGERVGEGMGED